MAEVTDYTEYLPEKPPESVIKEIREGYFTREYLVYKMDSYYDPLEDRNKRAVRCTCTACGGSVYLNKVPGRVCCHGAGVTTYGFYNPRTQYEVFDHDETSCPNCGDPVKVLHSSHFSNNSYGSVYQTEYPVTVHNIKGGLALLYWEVRLYIDKDARKTIITAPYDGYIFFKKKKICVTGREQAFFQKRYLYQWKQQKEYELTGEIDKLEEQAEDLAAEIKRLTAELEEMKNRPPVDAPNSDVAALIEEAEANVRAGTQKTIDELRADIEKKQKEIDKKQKQLDKLKNNDLAAENTKLKESVSEAEKKNAGLAAEIERLRKEAQLGSDKKLVALDLCFKAVQDDMNRLTDALTDCKGTENYKKLRVAVIDTLDNLLAGMTTVSAESEDNK